MQTMWSIMCLAVLAVADEPTVNPASHDLRAATHDAGVATHAARGAAATARAQQSAAEGQQLQYQAELQDAKLRAETPMDKSESATAVGNGERAAASAAAANEALESVKGMVDPTVKLAEELAAKEVHARLAEMYSNLDGWRNKVLRDPYAEAQAAGAAAAKPYYDGMKAYQARIQQYQGAAALAAGQANGLAASSVATAGAAQATMDGGNAVGGNQQMSEAHQQMAESGMLRGTANSLDGQAAEMNKQIPEYLAAAHLAAWRKMYEVNPNDFPPAPASVDAFTPAPVALLAQRETRLSETA